MSSTRRPPENDQRIAPQQPRTGGEGAARPRVRRGRAVGAVCAAVAAVLVAAALLAGPQLPAAQQAPAGAQGAQGQEQGAVGADASAANPSAQTSPAESAGTQAQGSAGEGAQQGGSAAQQGAGASAGSGSNGKGSGSVGSGEAGKAPAQPSGGSGSPAAQQITISFSVDASRAGSAYAAASVAERSLVLPQGASAYDALVAAGVAIGGNSTYVSSINGLAEKQGGPLSGWMYSVDGVFPQVSCGAFALEDGAVLVWAYTLDMGEDL